MERERILTYALELARKVYDDKFFNEPFRKAAKKLEETLLSDPKIIVNPRVPFVHINKNDPTKYVLACEPTRSSAYHEALHVLFALYEELTEDKTFRKVDHPAIEQARFLLLELYLEYLEKSKKFRYKYVIFPILRMLNRIDNFFDKLFPVVPFEIKDENPDVDILHFPVNIYRIERYDEKTRRKALDIFKEMAIYRLISYYGVDPFA